MKKLIAFTVLILVLGCQEKELIPNRAFEGTWKWNQSSGGIDGRTETPESTGEERSIRFTKTHKFSYVNGELIKEQLYSLQRGGSLYTTGVVELIIPENGNVQSYVIVGNLLTLRDECNDCFQHSYTKQ